MRNTQVENELSPLKDDRCVITFKRISWVASSASGKDPSMRRDKLNTRSRTLRSTVSKDDLSPAEAFWIRFCNSSFVNEFIIPLFWSADYICTEAYMKYCNYGCPSRQALAALPDRAFPYAEGIIINLHFPTNGCVPWMKALQAQLLYLNVCCLLIASFHIIWSCIIRQCYFYCVTEKIILFHNQYLHSLPSLPRWSRRHEWK